jgi:hypothetical protein
MRNSENNELCLSLDNDLYTLNKTIPDNIEKVLTTLHSYSAKLLRDNIQEKLHQAMEPEEV